MARISAGIRKSMPFSQTTTKPAAATIAMPAPRLNILRRLGTPKRNGISTNR
jgi:hypothetical protein